jgi:hypothetical protein
MITHQLLPDEGILMITPGAPLEAADFEKLAQQIDPYIEENGKLQGLLVDAEKFPGWKNVVGLVAHLKFVKNHHQKIKKIAIVSDSSVLAVAPKIASHFVQAQIKNFSQAQKEEALGWLKSA